MKILAEKSPETIEFCKKVLETERYGGNVVLMVVDSAITSVGVNYFSVVVPRVLEFKRRFVDTGMIESLEDFISAEENILFEIWRNRRSWSVAKGIAETLAEYGEGKNALRRWAERTELENWREWLNVRGAGINTFQYMRMMGGIDTVMPDRIVRRFICRFIKAPEDHLEFIRTVEKISEKIGFKSTEICWLSWLSSYKDEKIRTYSELLPKI